MEEAVTDDPLCVASALLISIDQVGDICFGDIISIDPIHRGLYSLKSDFETFSQEYLFKFIILQYMAFPRYASIIITSDNQNCTTQS